MKAVAWLKEAWRFLSHDISIHFWLGAIVGMAGEDFLTTYTPAWMSPSKPEPVWLCTLTPMIGFMALSVYLNSRGKAKNDNDQEGADNDEYTP